MPGNEVGDRVHNFFAPDNLSQVQHHSQLVDGNWPVLGNNLWVGSQRHVGGLSSSPKNYNLQQSDTEIGHGAHSLQVPHGMNFTQSTSRPDFTKSQSQSSQPNLNGYIHGCQVFPTRQNEANFLAVDTESDHHSIASRGLAVYEPQQGNVPEHHKNISVRSETSESPVRFDFLGGQQQMSGQPLSRQQSGFNDMQLLQQQIIYRKMQELQRQQQLQQQEARQQNSINQISAISGISVSNAPPYSWPTEPTASNTNLLQRGSPALERSSNGMFSLDQGQAMRFTGMVPQQVDQSLYGVPVSSTRSLQNQYSNIPIDKPPMQQISTCTNNYIPGNQYSVFPDQVTLQDGTLISRHGFQGKNLAGSSETSQEKPMMQIGPSDVALDPTEEKILFGTDDNIWDAFGGSINMGAGACNPSDGTGFLNGLPSVQSGSWSALMQSAVAETSSNDMGLQEEWSGLSFQNSELPTENRQPPTYSESAKQQTVFSDSVRFADDVNVNNNPGNISGFPKSGHKMPYEHGDNAQNDFSQRPIQHSSEEGSKWLNRGPLQKPFPEVSQNIHHSLDAETNAKSLCSSYNTGGQPFNKPHGWGVFESSSPSGDATLKIHERENSSKHLRSNDQKGAMYEEMGHVGSVWKSDSIPISGVEFEQGKSSIGSPQVNKQDSGLNNVGVIPNSSTTRAREETSQLPPNSHYPYWKHVDSSLKHTEASVKMHETENCDRKETSTGSLKENVWSDAGDSRSLPGAKQKLSGNAGRRTSGPRKFQYHPMGNLDEDVEPSYGMKHATTHLQGMSQQISRETNSQNQGYFGQSNFFGHVRKDSFGREQGYLPDLQGSTKTLDEAHSQQILPGYVPKTSASFDRSVGVSVPNKAAESSQNMLELLHKVDQSREHVTPMHFSSSERHPSSEMHEADNSDGSVGHFQQNMSSASQGFSLQLAPPSQRLHVPNLALSSQSSAQMVNSLSSSLTATEIKEKGHTWSASTPQIQSLPPFHETSQGELRSGKSDIPQQIGNETLSSALNSGFPYARSKIQNQQMTSTSGQVKTNQTVNISFDGLNSHFKQTEDTHSRALIGQSAPASLPDAAASVPHNNPTSYAEASQPTIQNLSHESVFAPQISAAEAVPASQQGAFLKMLPNAWTNVPAQQRLLHPQTHKGPLNLFMSHHSNNNVETTQNIKEKGPQKGANDPSEFGASSINSGGLVHEEEKAVNDSHGQQGKESIAKHFSDATHSNLHSAQKDIEAFGRSLKPNLHQNYSLLHQMRAIKSTETDPSDGLKRLKGTDADLEGQHTAPKTGQLNDQNTVGADSKMLSFSVPFSSRERNGSSQLGNVPSQDILAFSHSDPHTTSVRAEHPRISPQMAPSWFNQFGTFKNGQMLPIYDAQKSVSVKSLEHPATLGKSSDSLQTQHNSKEQVNAASVTSQVADACRSSPLTSIATEHFSSTQSLPARVTEQHLVVLRPKKRKSATSELLPWCKEVRHGSRNLLSISTSEADWAKAVNRLVDKVEDVAEINEDGPPMLRSKRRLMLTTQLMQQLLRPPPAAVLSADARSNYESVTHLVARVAIGDACSLMPSVRSNDSINLVSNKRKTSERNDDQLLSEATEDFIGRARKLENDLSRLDKRASILDLRVECQDLEKFSVINRFAKFHGRGQAEGAEASSSSDAAASAQKPFPQRYVNALPMPRNLPDRVQCLSL